jgi:2-C-methyl-D-erythritol 4-phosphate cytidylyltransferase
MGKAMTGNNVALILAAGKGTRLDKGKEKAFVPLLGKPLLAWTVSVFASFPHIHEIIVVVPPGRTVTCKNTVLSPYGFEKTRVVVGGAEREDSLRNGFAAIEEACHVVVVHDGARPFVDHEILRKGLDAAEKHGASVVAVPVKDTIKIGDATGMVQTTLDRVHLWSVQTPQSYRYDTLRRALAAANRGDARGTDDASLVERLGEPVKIVTGSYENIKITTPEDLLLGELLLRKRLQTKK